MIEGYLAEGSVVWVLVKGDILLEVMKLNWGLPGYNLNQFIQGFAFTGKNLGTAAYMKRKDIDDALKEKYFDEAQAQLLYENYNNFKYRLISAIPFPIVGKLNIKDGMILYQDPSNFLPPVQEMPKDTVKSKSSTVEVPKKEEQKTKQKKKSAWSDIH